MPILRVNDLAVYYEIRGEGPSLVLIPGLSADVSDYERFIGLLAPSCRVIAADNRGAGRTDKPDAPYSVEDMAEDTSALLRALDVGPAFVMGHSMGGRIALALTLRHPEQVKGLVLVSTGARVSGARRRVRILGALTHRTPGLRILGAHPQPYYAFVRQFEASRGFDCTQRLPEVRVPTLIIHGSRDRLAPPALAEELHAGISGSRILTVPGGHLALFFRPAPCVAAITGFVRTG